MSFDYLRYIVHQSEVVAVEIAIAVCTIVGLIQFINSKIKK